jgi:hypothetical protein
LFSNGLSLCSSLNIRDQVSHPYRTTGNIIVLYIIILAILDRRREDKHSQLNGSKHYPNSITSEHIYQSNIDFLLSFPNTSTLPHFQRMY